MEDWTIHPSWIQFFHELVNEVTQLPEFAPYAQLPPVALGLSEAHKFLQEVAMRRDSAEVQEHAKQLTLYFFNKCDVDVKEPATPEAVMKVKHHGLTVLNSLGFLPVPLG
jgi:hypothetical protein